MKYLLTKKRGGFTKVELILTIVGLIVLAGLLIFAVSDTRRRSRDAQKVSALRQIQFDLQAFRNETASYPETIEGMGSTSVESFIYQAIPLNCQVNTETLCSSYQIDLALEGRVGRLSGGNCQATPDGITCAP